MKEMCPKCGSSIQSGETTCPACSHIIVRHEESRVTETELDVPIPDGTVIAGDYLVVRLVGRGGGGRVYEARQISLRNMRVAIKVLHPDLNESEACLTLLKKEVIISRELTHENIIKVYSLEKTDGRHFIVMELVPGPDLLTVLKRKGRLSVQEMGSVFLKVCDALEYAHGRGVIHLDVKPANILLTSSGTVKLCDFGIARVAMGNVTTATQRLVTGSMGYMPPEQFAGRKNVSVKSDIYSLAATVYAALTGTVPVGGIRRDSVPESVFKGMEHDPDDRFESVAEFRRAFVRETGIGPAEPRLIQSLLPGDTVKLSEPADAAGPGATPTMEPVDLGLPDRPVLPVDVATFEQRSTVALSPEELPGGVPEKTPAGPGRGGPSGRLHFPAALQPIPGEMEGFPPEPKKSRKWIRVALGAGLLALAILVVGVIRHRTAAPLLAGKTYRIDVANYDWFDQRRSRDLSVRIFFPAAVKGPFPAILFSPPSGASAGAREHLGRYWATHGYVCIHLGHGDREEPGGRIGPPGVRPLRRLIRETESALNRPLDVRFALDRLETINAEDPLFKGKLDLGRIGLAGRGAGAVTALAVAGQVFVGPLGTETTFQDPRVKAVVLLNPFVPPRQKTHIDKAFDSIRIPSMHLVGLPERTPPHAIDAGDYQAPFAHINRADEYLVIFSPQGRPAAPAGDGTAGNARDKVVNELVRAGSTAFWDAYLKGDDKALHWLTGTGLVEALSNYGRVEVKMAPHE